MFTDIHSNLHFTNANEAFIFWYRKIMALGANTNIGTKAVYNVNFYLSHPLDRDITVKWRKWSKKYAEREWNWYLSQNRSVEELKKYAPTWDKMHGGDNIVNSNYGWQWNRNGQLDKCIEQLRDNKDTRQAWISIFDGKEKDQYKYDTPCTLNIGFSIKPTIPELLTMPELLHMSVIMRSCDLVYGFCNDQYCFSKLQELVAVELGLRIGTLHFFVSDLHIYEKHFNLRTCS